MLPQVTFLISRYQTLDELYVDDLRIEKSGNQLEPALIELYALILKYQMTLIIYLNTRITRIKTSLSTASKSDFQTI